LFIKVMVSVIITSAITRYDFRYNFIKVFRVANIFRYPISITLVSIQQLRLDYVYMDKQVYD